MQVGRGRLRHLCMPATAVITSIEIATSACSLLAMTLILDFLYKLQGTCCSLCG
jgi:hypothetical protein